MNKRTTMTYAVAAAIAATLTLAGCNGGDEDPTAGPTATTSSTSPSTSATTSASPTASASPSPSASVSVPPAARANTDAGAMAFARYYFEQVNAAYRKPDASIIPGLSTAECKSCDSLQETVQGYVSQSQKSASAPTAPLTNVKMRVGLPAERVMVSFTLTQNAVQVLDASGKVVDTQEMKQREQIAVLVWKEGRWFMNGLAAA